MLRDLCGMGLRFTIDGFRSTYLIIAVIMWSCTGVFSFDYFRDHREHIKSYAAFTIATFLAVCGIFASADMYTTFIFFEIMSFTSFVWVAHDRRDISMQAAYTYLTIAIIGGLVTLIGMWMYMSDYPHTGVTAFLLAVGFAAKAGAWPLHIWLPKAHPVAPAPASALLSGILTKTGIFGLIFITCNIVFVSSGSGLYIAWGEVWAVIGLITMFTGALLAVFSTDLKRVLACSSMSQIGFIIIGIAMYTLLRGSGEAKSALTASYGATLHMVNHSLIKLVLFMIAGVIYMNTHRLQLNDIRGFGRNKPLLMILFIIGAASISGIPGTSGYISKTLIHESIEEYAGLSAAPLRFEIYGWIFLLCGGMTFAYMLKLFVAIFMEKPVENKQGRYISIPGICSIILPACILLILGVTPYLTMNSLGYCCSSFWGVPLPADAAFSPTVYYSLKSLSGALISLGLGCVLYLTLIRGLLMKPASTGAEALANGGKAGISDQKEYADLWPAWLDLENLIYRPLLLKLIPAVLGFICAILSQAMDFVIVCARKTTHRQIATETYTGSMDNRMAILTGQALDKIAPRSDGSSRIPALIEKEERLSLTQRFITSSLSFGLILVCLGLILVLIYTLVSS